MEKLSKPQIYFYHIIWGTKEKWIELDVESVEYYPNIKSWVKKFMGPFEGLVQRQNNIPFFMKCIFKYSIYKINQTTKAISNPKIQYGATFTLKWYNFHTIYFFHFQPIEPNVTLKTIFLWIFLFIYLLFLNKK